MLEVLIPIIIVAWVIPGLWILGYCARKNLRSDYAWSAILFGPLGVPIVILSYIALLLEIQLRQSHGVEPSKYLRD